MTVQFFDRQDAANPLNGATLRDSAMIRDVIQKSQGRRPFLVELVSANGHKLLLGLGSDQGSAQFSATDGSLPYLMALGSDLRQEGHVEFLMGDTPSPVSRRFCLPMHEIAEIAAYFVDEGLRAPHVPWEEI